MVSGNLRCYQFDFIRPSAKLKEKLKWTVGPLLVPWQWLSLLKDKVQQGIHGKPQQGGGGEDGDGDGDGDDEEEDSVDAGEEEEEEEEGGTEEEEGGENEDGEEEGAEGEEDGSENEGDGDGDGNDGGSGVVVGLPGIEVNNRDASFESFFKIIFSPVN